jgi:transcriptional regulator with XRE-family HTH domain
MPACRRPTDLQGRRQDLHLTVEEFAAGIGVPVREIREIENGRGSDQRQNQYAAWLTRIESWPAGKRERELKAARIGQRFWESL